MSAAGRKPGKPAVWGPPLTISGGNILTQSLWHVAADARGNAIAVWVQFNGSDPTVQASLFSS